MMMKAFTVVIICWILSGCILMDPIHASDKNARPSYDPQETVIGPHYVAVPLKKIVLVRKGTGCCAVKFTDGWQGRTSEDMFATYESYYQGDGSGDFLRKNVEFKKDKLAIRRLIGIRVLSLPAGPENMEVQCGPIRLLWLGGEGWQTLHFRGRGQEDGDHGIEIAPTPWTDISEVRISDPRLKWYRYDERRPRLSLNIDKLWQEQKEDIVR
jgi:hypothetical protein